MSNTPLESSLLQTNAVFSGSYANAVTPLWAEVGASTAIPPDIQVSSITVGLPVGFEGGIVLDAPATNLGTTNAAPILFNRTDDYPSPNDYSRLAMFLTRGSSLYPPFSASGQNVALTDKFGTFYDTFATGDLLVYGRVNTANSPAGYVARLTQNLAADPNLPELDIDARAVHISSLFVSSINGAFPGGGGGYNPNLALSTLTMNQGGNITLQTSTSTSVLKQYSTTSDLYISSSGVVIDNLKVSSINGLFPGGGGGYNPNLALSTLTMNNGGNITLQVSSGTSVLRQWQNTSDVELTGSGLHLSTLYVSSISNYVFNVSTIQSDNVSSIAGQFGEATVGQLSSFVSNTVKQIVSSVSFNASLGGVNLGGVDLGLGGFLGGLTGQLVTGATSVTLSGVALATGATALALTRVSSNVYLPGQNSNGFNVVNGQTQLQFSTLGSPVSTFTRFTSSIAGSDPSVNPQPERVVFATIPAGTACIRSFSDPISPVNPSTFTSTLQSFGPWIPVPPSLFSTVLTDFVVGSNLRVGGNISSTSISTTSLRVAGNTQIVGALTTGTLTAGTSVVGSVVMPGGGVVNATSITANVAGLTNITATNLTVANINGSAYPPVSAQFSTTTGNFVVPSPYNLIAPSISTTNINAFGNILTPSISTNYILALDNITTPSLTTTDIVAAGGVRAASISTGSISTGTLRASNISTNSISTNTISTNVISATNVNTTTINGAAYPPVQSQFSTTTGNFVVPAPNNLFAPSISTVNVSTTNLRATNVDTTTINGAPYPPAQSQFSTTVGNFVVPAPNNLIAPNISTTNLRATGSLETGALVATNASIGGVSLGPAGGINGGAITGTSLAVTNVNTTTINNQAYPPVVPQFSTTTGNFIIPGSNILIVNNLISAKDINLGANGILSGNRVAVATGNIQVFDCQFPTFNAGIYSFRNGTLNANDNCITNLSTTNMIGNLNSSKTITASNFIGSNADFSGLHTAGIIQTTNLFASSILCAVSELSTITGVQSINGLPYPPPAGAAVSTFSTFTISSLTTNNIQSLANISTGRTLFASNVRAVGQVRGDELFANFINSVGLINGTTSITAGTTITAGGIIRGAAISSLGSLSGTTLVTTGGITAANASIGGTTLSPGGNVNVTNLTVSGTLGLPGNVTIGGDLAVTGKVTTRQLISQTDVIGATLNISNNALSINQTGTILTAAGNYTTTNGDITATNGNINAPNGNINANNFTGGTATLTGQVLADSFQAFGNIGGQTIFATSLINTGSASITQNLTVSSINGLPYPSVPSTINTSTINAYSVNATIGQIGTVSATTVGATTVSATSMTAVSTTTEYINKAINTTGFQQRLGSYDNFRPSETPSGSWSVSGLMMRAVGMTYQSQRASFGINASATIEIPGLQLDLQSPAVVKLIIQSYNNAGINVYGVWNLYMIWRRATSQTVCTAVVENGQQASIQVNNATFSGTSGIWKPTLTNQTGTFLNTLYASWLIQPFIA